jgi:phosphoglycerate kinase
MMAAALRDGTVDQVLTAGLVANVMLIAAGVEIGSASLEFIRQSQLEPFVAESKAILAEHGEKIVLPSDLAVVSGGARREVAVADLPAGEQIVDIGSRTIADYVAWIAACGTVFANGPAGVFEKPETEAGTKALWEAMAATQGFSAVGGGDSVRAVNRFGLAERFDYICTAGGAMVQFLSGKPLAAIEALKESAARFASSGVSQRRDRWTG